MKVYIAGKITGDPFYRPKFARAKMTVEAEGHIVLVPSMLPAGMDNADYMRICFAMIDSADLVLFLPDWKDSEGAKLERQYCAYLKKPFTTMGETELTEGGHT